MGGSSPPTTTTTSTDKAPAWAVPAQKAGLTATQNALLPGGQPAPDPIPNQQVAPFTQDQLASMGLTEQLTAPEQQFLGGAQGQQAATIGGQYLNPSSNQYLQAYYDAAAQPMIANYETAIAPNILQNAVASGGLGSSGTEQAFSNAQSELAQGLGTLGANIYEPAYMQERQLQQGASQFAPNMAQAQYLPGQALAGVGSQQQGQMQNVLDTAFKNLSQRGNWPMQDLSQYGTLLNQMIGNSNQATITAPNMAATGK